MHIDSDATTLTDEQYAEQMKRRWFHVTTTRHAPAIVREGLRPGTGGHVELSADEPLWDLISFCHLTWEADESVELVGFEVDLLQVPREHVTPGFDSMTDQLGVSCVIPPSALTRLPAWS